MLLGYHTNSLQNHRLGDALRLLADHGYGAVAITPDTCHLDPFHGSAREIEATAALLQQLSLQPVIETGARYLLDAQHKHEPTLMTADPAGRARRLDYYRRAAAIGRDLGARVLSFWTGIDRAPDADSTARMHDGIAATCELVRAAGLVPALEPEPGMAVATVADWRAVRAALGGDAPRLTLDVGHLYVEDEGDPVALCAACAADVEQVHLEDMRRGVHEHLVPGEGEVDFAGVLGALAGAGYDGPVCFELSRSSHMAPAAVARCRELWRAAGRS
ncbi:MAG: sugar phosphate isomerase/epimerase family protein [Planctomycetota bacterium]